MVKELTMSAAALASIGLLFGTLALADEVTDMMDSGLFDSGEADSGGVDSGEADSGGVDSGEADSGGVDSATDTGDTTYAGRSCPRLRVVACCNDADLQAYATAEGIPLEEADSFLCADHLMEKTLKAAGTSMQDVFDNPESICVQTCAPLAANEMTWADVNQYSSGYTSPSCDKKSDRTIIDVECHAVSSP